MSDGSSDRREAVVVGAGVSGLSSAVRLLERGFGVTVVAPAMPSDAAYEAGSPGAPAPCSPWAAAVWYPYHMAEDARSMRWLRETYDELNALAEDPSSGVFIVELVESLGEGVEPPETIRAMEPRWLAPSEVPAGYVRAYTVRVPTVDTSVYLPYLERRFAALGGRFERRVLARLADVFADGRVVVNCTGLGARALVPDEHVRPSRGQVLRVRKPEGFPARGIVGVASDGTPTYVFPRTRDVILGGTDGMDDWREGADAPVVEQIRARCAELVPEIADAEILSAGSGLRPVREGGQVRVESEPAPGGRCALIHNYGHGGSGYTISWGCADEVARLADEAIAWLAEV